MSNDDPDATVPEKPNAVVRERPSLSNARYLTGDEIARGGMGRVALATDTLLERTVAVKQALTLDPEMLRRFKRETKITARLEHPSIVPVYDAGTDGEAPFYVMRRVSGRPLSELIVKASLDARLALVPNLLAAAQAVAHAHSRGIVHRDIKPANILVGSLGETVVIDWGLAKVVDEPEADDPMEVTAGDSLRTRVGTVFGTPGFMSPNQLRGDPVDYAGDIYALGASLYFLLSGKPPHHAPTGDAMMILAAQGPPVPLAKLVPGVPRELAAIVDTALAYGDSTYSDASAFVEDLRRFSTGQLVAAHHYSSGERMKRFIRMHRAAVAIAVIALAVIAVGATFAFRSILQERDRADAEAAVAVAARLQERDRADQLVMTRARLLVETNPTEALALLAEIDPSSKRVAEAHGLVSGAMMRGVPWAMRPPTAVAAMVEIEPTGDRLLQTTVLGELYVWDLNTRTQVLKRQFDASNGVRGSWLGKRILLHGKIAPALLDPATDSTTPVQLPQLRSIVSSDDQRINLGLTADGQVAQFDLDGHLVRMLWPGHKVDYALVTGNGAWIALSTETELVVLSPDGNQLLSRTGKLGSMRVSQFGRLAVADDLDVYELEIATQTWTRIDSSRFHKYVVAFGYRGDELQLAMGSGHFLAWREARLVEVARSSGLAAFAEAGDREFLYVFSQNELFFMHEWGARRIPLPQLLTSPRLAARRGCERVVVSSGEAILIYDLDKVRPHQLRVPQQVSTLLYDNNTLLMVSDVGAKVSWFDVDTHKTTVVPTALPSIAHTFTVDPDLGKVIVNVWLGDTSRLFELREHSAEAKLIYEGPPVENVEMLSDGNVVMTREKDVFLLGTPERKLATLTTEITVASARGRDFVAVSDDGELVRGDANGMLEKIQLPQPPELVRRAPSGRMLLPHLAVGPRGDIVVAWGVNVWRWTDRLEPLFWFTAPITGVHVVDNNVLVLMPNRRAVLGSLATREMHELPMQSTEMVLPLAKRDSLGLDVNGLYHFVDLTSFTTWPSTIQRWGQEPHLSPDGKTLIIRTPFEILMWTIPLGSGPLRPRIEAVTNASINREGLLTWPWLQR